MIEMTQYAIWMAALSDRFGRKLQPETQSGYYAMLSPILSTDEFERAAQQIFRDERFWPEPKMFIELGQPGRGRPQKYLPPPRQGRQTFVGDCFEKDSRGQHLEHKAVCSCGRDYLQFELSLAWMDAIADGPRQAMLAEFPNGRCPTECPSCARKILATGISYPRAPHERERPEWAA